MKKNKIINLTKSIGYQRKVSNDFDGNKVSKSLDFSTINLIQRINYAQRYGKEIDGQTTTSNYF